MRDMWLSKATLAYNDKTTIFGINNVYIDILF